MRMLLRRHLSARLWLSLVLLLARPVPPSPRVRRYFYFNDAAALEIYTLSLHSSLFFFNDTATTEISTLSLHDALPILGAARAARERRVSAGAPHLRRSGAAPAAPRARRAASRVLRSGRGGDGARSGHGHLPALGADEAGAPGVGRPHLGAAGRRGARRAAGLRRGG